MEKCFFRSKLSIFGDGDLGLLLLTLFQIKEHVEMNDAFKKNARKKGHINNNISELNEKQSFAHDLFASAVCQHENSTTFGRL